MHGHIVVIGTGRSQNWDVARDAGLWASRRGQRVEPGDLLFFWEAGEGLKHAARATTGGEPVGRTEVLPWSDHASHDYKWKFGLEVLVESPHAVETSWPRVQEMLGSGVLPNHSVIAVPEGDPLDRLRALFPHLREPGPAHAAVSGFPDGLDWPDDYDERDHVVRGVAVRRGQRVFRQALLAAYDSSCAVTRYRTAPVLEAAHIDAYRGQLTNDDRNGLLLRADVHALFDLHLLTVLPSGVVRTSPTLTGSQYEDFDNRPILRPTSAALRPDPERLTAHNATCTWLG